MREKGREEIDGGKIEDHNIREKWEIEEKETKEKKKRREEKKKTKKTE